MVKRVSRAKWRNYDELSRILWIKGISFCITLHNQSLDLLHINYFVKPSSNLIKLSWSFVFMVNFCSNFFPVHFSVLYQQAVFSLRNLNQTGCLIFAQFKSDWSGHRLITYCTGRQSFKYLLSLIWDNDFDWEGMAYIVHYILTTLCIEIKVFFLKTNILNKTICHSDIWGSGLGTTV